MRGRLVKESVIRQLFAGRYFVLYHTFCLTATFILLHFLSITASAITAAAQAALEAKYGLDMPLMEQQVGNGTRAEAYDALINAVIASPHSEVPALPPWSGVRLIFSTSIVLMPSILHAHERVPADQIFSLHKKARDPA